MSLLKTKIALSFVAAAFAGGACAQAYPARPVKVIVPFGPGTSTDVTARVFAGSMTKSLGQPVVVENKPGAGGSIGTDAVAKSAPDGYTLTFGSVGTFAINKALYKKLAYDPAKDFTLLAMPGYTPTLLVVNASSKYKTVSDLTGFAAANPDKLNYASAGNGTSGHLAGELLKTMSKTTMQHIPYKEGGQAVTAVMSGEADLMFYHPTAVMPQIKAGKLRALAVSSANRASTAPDVPTMAESGFPGFDMTAWYMLAAPAGVPADVRKKLLEAAHYAMNDPAVKQTFASQGIEASNIGPDKLDEFVKTEIGKWGKIVKQANAQID